MAVRSRFRIVFIVVGILLAILFSVLALIIACIKWYQMPSVSEQEASTNDIALVFTLNEEGKFAGMPALFPSVQMGSVVLVKADGSAHALKTGEVDGGTVLWSNQGIMVPSNHGDFCITSDGLRRLLSAEHSCEMLRVPLSHDRFLAYYKNGERRASHCQRLVVGDATQAQSVDIPGDFMSMGVSNDVLYACSELRMLSPDLAQAAQEHYAASHETARDGQQRDEPAKLDALIQLYPLENQQPQILAVAPHDDTLTLTAHEYLRHGDTLTILGFRRTGDDPQHPKQGMPVLVHWNLKTQERSYQPLTISTGEPRLWTDDDFFVEASQFEGDICTVVLRGGMVMSIDMSTGNSEVQGMIPTPESGSFVGTAFVIQDSFVYLLTISDPSACITSADLSRFSLKDGSSQHLLTVEGITYGCNGLNDGISIPGFALNPDWVKSLDH